MKKIYYATYIITRKHNVKTGSKKIQLFTGLKSQLFMFNIILQISQISHKQVHHLIFILPKKIIPYHKTYGCEVISKQTLYVQ